MQVQLANDEEDELFTQILLAPMENPSRCRHGGSMPRHRGNFDRQ
jgi:hypothetical protein